MSDTGGAPPALPVAVGADAGVDVGLRQLVAAVARAVPGVSVIVAERRGEPADSLAQRSAVLGSAGCVRLSLRVVGDTLQVGPLLRAGDRGCDWCADRRHRAVLRDDAQDGIRTGTSTLIADDLDRCVVAPTWAPTVAALAADLLADAPTGAPDAAKTVHALQLVTGCVQRHRVDPVLSCPHCGPGAVADPPAAFVPRAIRDVAALRCRPVPEVAELEAALVDHRFGPVRRVYRDAFAPGALAGVEVALPGVARRLWGYGRAVTHPSARTVALLEAVERESGCSPQRAHAMLHGSHRDLLAMPGAGAVLDPASLGLPEDRWAAHPAAVTTAYGPDEPTTWIRGWSPTRGETCWVPEHVAYYGAPDRRGSARFLYECSNGVAVGGTREEAAVYGAFELIERDAFLLHWYARAPLAPIDPRTVDDPETLVYLERAAAEGYAVHLFDATSDVGLPVVQALAVDPGNHEGATFSAAGGHPDPRRAARAAVQEVVVMIVLQERGPRRSRDERLAMLADPALVREMDDHVAVHTLPEAIARFDHLLHGGRSMVGLDDLATKRFDADPHAPDMAAVASAVFGAMAEAGMDPVIIDLSSARDERLDLSVVKVIAAGAIPLTFGHVHHRTVGIPRLDAARELTGESGEFLVHPFP
jgi:bacteriocin biosynthesis cyclodehydratase domain-containing protein